MFGSRPSRPDRFVHRVAKRHVVGRAPMAPAMTPLATLIEALSPGARITDTQALRGGVSAQVTAVRFTTPDGAPDAVVVRQRGAVAWGERRSMEVEYALLSHLHQTQLPIPRPRLWWPPDTIVMDFVEGTAEVPRGGEARMATALALVHEQAAPLLEQLPERESPLSEVQGLLAQSQLADVHAAFDAAKHEKCLLHGDFSPANLLWRGEDLVAVLDWEDAALGDPLSDVACARAELAVASGQASCSAFTEHYFETTKRDATRLPLWDLYVAVTALEAMDQWSLAPQVLAHRRAATETFRDRALRQLMK